MKTGEWGEGRGQDVPNIQHQLPADPPGSLPAPASLPHAFLGLGMGTPNVPTGRLQLTRREDVVPPAPGVIKQTRASWCLAFALNELTFKEQPHS